MKVEVRLYAVLARCRAGYTSGEALPLDVPGGTTIRQLLEGVLNVPPIEVKAVFVNGLARDFDHPLAEGDRVGIFPPIAGG